MIQFQLDELWGTFLGQVRASDLTSPAAEAFFDKYEELISATPLQFQTEMLFVVRAMGILSGITSHLDPKFDPWTETASFAQGLIEEDITKVVRSAAQDLVSGRLPSAIGTLLGLLPQPRPNLHQNPAVDTRRSEEIRRLLRMVNRLTALVVAGGMLAVGVVVQANRVRVGDAAAFLWAGNDLGQWLIEISCIAILIILLRRGSNK
jgi:predicted unusual protein kinase regulating ubiquinone biosynthesis (AarF/ABC1/UbiB family)